MMANLFERLGQQPSPPTTKETQEPLPDQKLEPAQKLLDWLQRWNKDTVCMKDILQYGPNSLRNPRKALDAAHTLVRNGWLEPAELHRYDMHKWHIARNPVVPPTVKWQRKSQQNKQNPPITVAN